MGLHSFEARNQEARRPSFHLPFLRSHSISVHALCTTWTLLVLFVSLIVFLHHVVLKSLILASTLEMPFSAF